MYLVMVINKTADVRTYLGTQELELSWIDWQIWACPVFKYKKDALKYTNWRKDIILKVSQID